MGPDRHETNASPGGHTPTGGEPATSDDLTVESGSLRETAPSDPGENDASRRRFAIVAIGALACMVLLLGTVVLGARGQRVLTTVSAAEAIPASTTRVESTTPISEVPVEESTTTEATSPPEPVAEEPDVPIELTRPSTVLTGKTVGQIPVFTSPGGSPKLTLPHPRAINGNPNTPVPLILLAKQLQGEWIEVYLPVRPNRSTGWVRRSDFTTSTHDFLIEVHLSRFNLKVYDGSQLFMNTSIGVATDNSPTPGGLYYTIELLAPPDPRGPYGPYAYGLSGYSNVYQSFGGGPGQLGIHGTNQPGAIGQKVSHGCIRLSNQDITTLARKLPLGVPVLVNRN